MSAANRTAAVYAGLLGTLMYVAPTPALALPLEELATPAMVPYLHFTLGCIAGAALSTTIHMTVSAISKARRARYEEKDVTPIRQVMEMSRGQVDDVDNPSASSSRPIAASKAAARHMAARDWEASGVIRVQEVSAEPAQKPAVESVGAHAATDYTDIAEKYVHRKTLRERMSTRTSGVAAVLAERLGGNPLEGLPVIERADGTVGDVGTAWWERALSSSIRRIDDIPDEAFEAVTDNLSSSASLAQEHFEESRMASNRSAYISKNVAEVNVGVYPEHRSGADLDREDIWELALAAMDERLGTAPNPVFADAIGTIETIDEPDGLEGSTGFIPFRLPAGHPEVVDADSYVDYLIDDEFSRNPSSVARKSSHEFLTVIQGGSQRMRPLAGKSEQASHRPKHFAPEHSLLAKEA